MKLCIAAGTKLVPTLTGEVQEVERQYRETSSSTRVGANRAHEVQRDDGAVEDGDTHRLPTWHVHEHPPDPEGGRRRQQRHEGGNELCAALLRAGQAVGDLGFLDLPDEVSLHDHGVRGDVHSSVATTNRHLPPNPSRAVG